MEREEKIEKLRRLIEEAFTDVPYPGDHGITKENHCFECLEIAEALRGQRWQDITPEYFHKHRDLIDAFPLLRPAAARYFLPAYLLIFIECYDDEADNFDVFPEHFLYHLTNDSAKYESRFLERFEPLTEGQKRAVRLSLEYLLEEYPEEYSKSIDDTIVLALERYWGDRS